MLGSTAGVRTWTSSRTFVLAAIGAAVGLGNIWKFPYIVGSNGGGIFVTVYILCIVVVALPLLIAELMVGRAGHHSPPVAVASVAADLGVSKRWSVLGWVGLLASLFIATFYAVISGWTLAYIPLAARSFNTSQGISAAEVFGDFLADPKGMTLWYSVFLVGTLIIVARGVRGGIEATIRLLMPALFVLILGLTIYSCTNGDLAAGLDYLFSMDFSKVTPGIVADAVGQAFFSIGLGAGLMMTYGAYLPKGVSVVRSAVVIVLADTVIALLAGVMIFPLVFGNGLDPAEGPGLVFVTLPTAFVVMPGGLYFGVLFFMLLAVAAVTSLIGAIEPSISYAEDRWGMRRSVSCSIVGIFLWSAGLLTVFSFNIMSDVSPLAWLGVFDGMTAFDLLDKLTANVMLPLGGVLLSIFVGWRIPRSFLERELSFGSNALAGLWLFLIRFVAPVGISMMFVSNLV